MFGRDGLQIFIICFQTIHIDNLIDGEDGEQKRQNDTYPGIDITIPFVAWFIEYNTDALFYFVPTVYKLILQRVWRMIIIIWNGASLLVNCLKHLPVGKFSFIVQFLDIGIFLFLVIDPQTFIEEDDLLTKFFFCLEMQSFDLNVHFGHDRFAWFFL